MHKTFGDIALMNNGRETNYFHDFVQFSKQKFFASPQPQYVLSMFLNFGRFGALCFYLKRGFIKKEYVTRVWQNWLGTTKVSDKKSKTISLLHPKVNHKKVPSTSFLN